MPSPLVEKATQVLNLNWKNGFTIPTSKLYPFQWNWDSGFVSLGWGHVEPKRAMQELRSLFSAQWQNGMIPHIVFHSERETTYFPNWDFWTSEVNPGAPRSPKTSGITQPPVHGFMLEELLKLHPDNAALHEFAKFLFPKIVDSHRFFYHYRDPHREGLCFIYHPWESGRDNSPLWDDSMRRIRIDYDKLPKYTRKDTTLADAAERPTTEQYDRYVYLLELGKRYRYDGPEIARESPFLIQDSLLNAILIRSNESLIRIGERLKFDTAEIEAWQQQSIPRYREKLWNEDLACFVAYDLRAGRQVAHREIGGISALFGGIPTEQQAARIHEYLLDLHRRGYYLCPSFDVDSPLFDSRRYWRGPIWPQMNWMIHRGLQRYGFSGTAGIVRDDLLELVRRLGFYEYFESQKSVVGGLQHGYGGDSFSWTASSVLGFELDRAV